MFCVQPETDHSTLINIMYSVGSLSNRIKNEGERMKKKRQNEKYIYIQRKKNHASGNNGHIHRAAAE